MMKPVTIAEFKRKFLKLKKGERSEIAWLFREFKACGYVLMKPAKRNAPRRNRKGLK